MIKEMPFLVFISTFFDCFIKLFIIMRLTMNNTKYDNKRFLFTLVIISLYAFTSYMVTDSFIRLILLFIVNFIGVCFISRIDLKECIKALICTFSVWIVLVLADILLNIIVVEIFNVNMNDYRNNIWLVLSINFFVLFIVTLVFYDIKVRKLVHRLSDIQLNSKNLYILITILVSVIFFSIIFYLCIFSFDHILILCTIFIMVIVYTFITLNTIREFNLKNKLKSEYDILLSNLSEYENLLDRQRIINHENKNQLLVIKGMINDNKKADAYINTLLEEQYSENDMLIAKTNKIPSGGLKGLIYYKMITMKDKKIDVSLEVGNLQRVTYLEMNPKINQDLCKIVGVLLDNAIQEVENLNEKNINIVIENQNKDLIIKISNNYGEVELHRIGENGYTTKGKGHGYGLKLVKQIVTNNDDFEQYTEISGKVFSQIIKLHTK